MADTRYEVVGAGALVNTTANTAVWVTSGAPVPDNAAPDHVEHLLSIGLIAERPGEFVGGLERVFTGDLQQQLTARTKEGAKALEEHDTEQAVVVNDAPAVDADKQVKDSDGGHAPARSAAKKST